MQGIRGDWLGQPYRDLLGVIAHLEQLPYLDQSKGIIGGGSYGGLMISWMMGHDIIKKVCQFFPFPSPKTWHGIEYIEYSADKVCV